MTSAPPPIRSSSAAPGRALALGLTAAALLWVLAILGAPRLISSPVWGSAAAMVYSGAARICHQRPERSFHAGHFQWPVCARCSGLYLSAAAGTIIGWTGILGWRNSRERWVFALAAIPTAATWSLEMLGMLPFSNTARAVAALPLGAAAGWLFVQMLRYDSGLDARQIDRSGPRTHAF